MAAHDEHHAHDFPAINRACWSIHLVSEHEIPHSLVQRFTTGQLRDIHDRDHAAIDEAAAALARYEDAQ